MNDKKLHCIIHYIIPCIFFCFFLASRPCLGVSIQFSPGWNVIGLPALPKEPYRASDLAAEIAKQYGNCNIIQSWQGGQWSSFLAGFPGAGVGFPLKVGEGYLVYAGNSFQLNIEATQGAATASISLQPGWNVISLPALPKEPYRASDLAAEIAKQYGNCNIIQSWQGGQWRSFLAGFPGAGTGFPLKLGEGYFVYCSQASTLMFDTTPPQPAQISLAAEKNIYSVGETVRVAVDIQKASDLYGSPFHLLYDRQYLQLKQAREGDFLKSDGQPTIFVTHNNEITRAGKQTGELVVGLNRIGQTGGVNGNGTLVIIEFQALSSGQVTLSFEQAILQDAAGARLTADWQPLTLSVR